MEEPVTVRVVDGADDAAAGGGVTIRLVPDSHVRLLKLLLATKYLKLHGGAHTDSVTAT